MRFPRKAMLASCGARGSPAAELLAVTVQLLWTHNAEFAGFYAADRLGYYADEAIYGQ